MTIHDTLKALQQLANEDKSNVKQTNPLEANTNEQERVAEEPIILDANLRPIEIGNIANKPKSPTNSPAEKLEPLTQAQPEQATKIEEPQEPQKPTKTSGKNFNIVEALKDAQVEGNLALLRRGSKNRAAIETAQKMLVEAGFLQTEDKSAPNYINPEHFGHMDGNVTSRALHNLQKAMKEAGADIKVDSKNRVRGYTETWTALAVCQHLGIKNGEITQEAVALYNSSKSSDEIKSIARFNAETIEGVEKIKESPLGTTSPTNLRVAQEKTLLSQIG